MDVRCLTGVHCSRGIGPSGGGRRENEDNFLIAHGRRARFIAGGRERELHTHRSPGLMLAVADGMGGHEHGATASSAAVQALARLFDRGRPHAPGHALRHFVLEAHRRLRARASQAGLANMGTTLTVLWVLGDTAWWLHVGDSRLYRLRGENLQQLTRDHTRAEFARRDGHPQPSQPDALRQNFLFGSRGLGDDTGIRIDEGVDTGAVHLHSGDRFLLCSDGISGHLSPEQLTRILSARSESPSSTAQLLAREALGAGSSDNLTAVVMHVA